MKTSLKFLFTEIVSLAAVTGLSVVPANAELADFDRDNTSPNTVTGYPAPKTLAVLLLPHR